MSSAAAVTGTTAAMTRARLDFNHVLGRGPSRRAIQREFIAEHAAEQKEKFEARHGKMGREELIDARVQGRAMEPEVWFLHCLLIGEDPTALRHEAEDRLRAERIAAVGRSHSACRVNPTPRNVNALTDALVAAGIHGDMKAVVDALTDATSVDEVRASGILGLVRHVEGLVRDHAPGRATSVGGIGPGVQVARPVSRVRARAGLGVRVSSGQRRTKSANSAGSSSGDDGPQPDDPPPAAQPPRRRDSWRTYGGPLRPSPALIGGAA